MGVFCYPPILMLLPQDASGFSSRTMTATNARSGAHCRYLSTGITGSGIQTKVAPDAPRTGAKQSTKPGNNQAVRAR